MPVRDHGRYSDRSPEQLLRMARLERAPTAVREEIERLRAENRKFRSMLSGENLDALYKSGKLAELANGSDPTRRPDSKREGPTDAVDLDGHRGATKSVPHRIAMLLDSKQLDRRRRSVGQHDLARLAHIKIDRTEKGIQSPFIPPHEQRHEEKQREERRHRESPLHRTNSKKKTE